MKAAVKTLMAMGLVLLAAVSSVAQAEVVRGNYSSIELVSEVSSIAPGQTFTLGLHVTPDSHWHNYWMNPGEAGKEMKVKWKDLPEGFSVADFVYQVPHIVAMGDIVTYGYSEPNTILMDITAPAGLTGDSVTLQGKASWLVCDDANCVPERANISITLPVGDGSIDAGNVALFNEARKHQPQNVDWDASFYAQDGNVNFEVAFPEEGATGFYVWPAKAKLIVHEHNQTSSLQNGVLTVSAPEGKRLAKYDETGLLVTYTDANGKDQAKFVSGAGKADTAGTVKAAAPASVSGNSAGGDGEISFLVALGGAFLGGLILNLMPCVLPVLSLKMLSLAKMGESHPREVKSSGVYYTVGVVLSFVAMAIIVIAIKAAGEAASWGFQMQNPAVVLSLVVLMTLIGLNLVGVFEFGTSMMNVGSGLTDEADAHSKKSSFWTGVLAVVVATPCTAPFMAGALGYAFTQPWYTSLIIFVSLGLGLAFPYLLIAFVPKAQRIVPNPGPWMGVFKTALAFPMFGTAVWMLWVLGDRGPIIWALATALIVALAAWAWGRVPMANRPTAWRATAVIALLVALVPGYWTLQAKEDAIAESQQAAEAKAETEAIIAGLRKALESGGDVAGAADVLQQLAARDAKEEEGEIAYSEAKLMSLLGRGKGVFAYFTADWCVSCKANEKASLHKDETLAFFEENNIAVMVGDYTDEDDAITEIIDLYEHPGVPLYLYFKPGDQLVDGRKLPQILATPDAIISKIKNF